MMRQHSAGSAAGHTGIAAAAADGARAGAAAAADAGFTTTEEIPVPQGGYAMRPYFPCGR